MIVSQKYGWGRFQPSLAKTSCGGRHRRRHVLVRAGGDGGSLSYATLGYLFVRIDGARRQAHADAGQSGDL